MKHFAEMASDYIKNDSFHGDRFMHSSIIKTTIREYALLVLVTGWIYEIRHWDSHGWHDICTRFNNDCFRH